MQNQYLQLDAWKIIEKGFNAENHEASESIFSIGNGKMGQRAMFEETYSGKTLQGSYIAGIYYPDKTRVGWWKNGYPEYFAKVVNSPNWIGINVEIDGETLDLANVKCRDFNRVLDMKKGLLQRSFIAVMPDGTEVKVESTRFVSMADDELGIINYSVTPINKDIKLKLSPYIYGDVLNADANYDEKFWKPVSQTIRDDYAGLVAQTKKTTFTAAFGMTWEIDEKGKLLESEIIDETEFVGHTITIDVAQKEAITLTKYVSLVTSLYYPEETLAKQAEKKVFEAKQKGFTNLINAHTNVWEEIWSHADIKISGDVAAQQAIRFNIFQLYQTYTGKDERLNIGPKGFTGEKYGGSTYWDTEAYCLPFFLNTAPYKVARQLLVYRYKHLPKAIANAEKLGFINGAALYPMVTMNGEECHNEWEITFEEVHRNGAIAFAIYNYVRHSGDECYLSEFGLEVLIAIARFWAQRVNWSERKNQYVMLGVTGPNEYENNINNNFYTNYLAKWVLQYTMEAIEIVGKKERKQLKTIFDKTNFNPDQELLFWRDVIDKMYFPYDKELQVYLQQDNFLDKDIIPAAQLPTNMRPLNQYWSWDRILRSCYIKQADTLQTFYFFEDDFTHDELARHFDFYETITVHESSLSPCVHVVLAAALGRMEKAYELYLRTARLDLDDYNREVAEGLHITSMAGTWMAVVEGFGGLRIKNDQLHLNPQTPKQWKDYSFKTMFRDNILKAHISSNEVKLSNEEGGELIVSVWGKKITLKKGEEITITPTR